MPLEIWALLGLLGAFMYASPRALVAVAESENSGQRVRHIAEFILALSFGPIAGAGFGPLLAGEFHRTSLAELRAIAIVVGMVANRLAPEIVHLASDTLRRWLNAPLKPLRKGPTP